MVRDLTPEETKERYRKLVNCGAAHGCDLLILGGSRSNSPFSKWLAGVMCRSPQHYLILTPTEVYFLEVSYRATELRSQTHLPIEEVLDEDSYGSTLAKVTRGARRIGVGGVVPWRDVSQIKPECLTDLSRPLGELLAIKSKNEILDIADLARELRKIVTQSIQFGEEETAIYQAIRRGFLERGGTEAFSTTVISGPRLMKGTVGAPAQRVVTDSDLLLIDAGLTAGGLYTDLTVMEAGRDSSLGAEVQALDRAVRQVAVEVRTGLTIGDLHQMVRRKITEIGFDSGTLVSADLGHGIGFSLHEYPLFVRPETDSVALCDGMVLTLEPEVFHRGHWLRVEHMIAIVEGRAMLLGDESNEWSG